MSRRFTTRSLLALMLCMCCALAMYRIAIVRHRVEQAAIRSLSDDRFSISFQRTRPRWAIFLPSGIAEKFSKVTRLHVFGGQLNEEVGLVTEAKTFTDAHIFDVLKLKHLRYLSVARTSVTYDGLSKLTHLRQLRSLNVCGTQTSPRDCEKLIRDNPDCLVCTSPGLVDLRYWPGRKILVQGTEISSEDVEGRLSYAFKAAQSVGYDEVRLSVSHGFAPDNMADAHYDEFIENVRAVAAKLGYHQMDWFVGANRKHYDLANDQELTLQETSEGYWALRPPKKSSAKGD